MSDHMQKYKKGDYVRVAKDLGDGMRHFQNDCEAIVVGSYADQCGGNDHKSYTIFIKNSTSTSWYKEHQLELIEAGRLDLLKDWEDAEQKEIDRVSDLDWIFNNGDEVLERPYSSSLQALADCFGLTNLWGSRGEGIDLRSNSIQTLRLAAPFLETGDKEGWLERCKSITVTVIKTDSINEPLKIE